MELMHWILDFTLVPGAIFFLFFAVPPLLALRVGSWVWGALFPVQIRNKVVVITGASSGIGEHIAYNYAKRKARLTLVATSEERLRAVASRCKVLGSPDVLVKTGDVSKEEDCKAFIDATIERFGRLDHLVNNAGIAHIFRLEEAKTTEVKKIMDTDFWGSIYPTYYALPHLKHTHGQIVVIASVVSYIPYPRMALYNASKAGLFNFYDTLRVELGSEVPITIVAPGWVESEMTAGKFMTGDAKVKYDPQQRDAHVGPFPVEPVSTVGAAVVQAALRRQRYLFVPFWYTTFIFFRVFVPDLMDLMMRFTLLFKIPSTEKPLSKLVMETPAKTMLYPESIQKS